MPQRPRDYKNWDNMLHVFSKQAWIKLHYRSSACRRTTQHLICPNLISFAAMDVFPSTGSITKPPMWAATELRAVNARFHHSASFCNSIESDSFPPGSRASKQQAASEPLNAWVTASRDGQIIPRASSRRRLWSTETGYWMDVNGVMEWWPHPPS